MSLLMADPQTVTVSLSLASQLQVSTSQMVFESLLTQEIKKPLRKRPSNKPVAKKPVIKKPVTKKPVTKQPVTNKPVFKKPVKKPVKVKPVTRKPTRKPTIKKSTYLSCFINIGPSVIIESSTLSESGTLSEASNSCSRYCLACYQSSCSVFGWADGTTHVVYSSVPNEKIAFYSSFLTKFSYCAGSNCNTPVDDSTYCSN